VTKDLTPSDRTEPLAPGSPLSRRIELLEAVERNVSEMARELRAPPEVSLAAQARLIHAMIHRVNVLREEDAAVDCILASLEDIAYRSLAREMKKRLLQGQASRAPVLDDEETRRILGDPFARRPRAGWYKVVRAYKALSPIEHQVLRLKGTGYSVGETAMILGLTANAVEFHGSQARQKLNRIYHEGR
jgi:DNA-binding NarL/FixJ family response regulator